MIEGFEAAWAFFGGVFKVVIPDNMATIVTKADRIEPRLNQAFVEYAQARGSSSTRPGCGPRRTSPEWSGPSRSCGTASSPGRRFIDLADAQRRAVEWCAGRAGRRIHGTHACRPVELFEMEEKPRLLPAPTGRYDLPVYATAKVHRDHHIEIARALYSIPGNLIGAQVEVRADRKLVRVFYRGRC